MLKYLLKRLLYIVPMFIILTFLVFAVLDLSPGDPVLMILGTTATTDQISALTTELGLDQPLLVRYANYMINMFKGDFGKSWLTGNSVAVEMGQRMVNTIRLALGALLLTVIIGIPLGVLAAVYQNGPVDRITLVSALFFISMPEFFIALICQLVFALRFGWLPATGADTFKHFILPTLMLAAAQIAGQIRMTRSSMLDVISQDYIRTAYAKGDNKYRVITHHALRNGLMPVVTGIGNAVARLISGAAVIEIVFAIPGMGNMMVSAVQTSDVPMVMGPIIIIALWVMLVNTIVDMIYAFIDPRVKLRFAKG